MQGYEVGLTKFNNMVFSVSRSLRLLVLVNTLISLLVSWSFGLFVFCFSASHDLPAIKKEQLIINYNIIYNIYIIIYLLNRYVRVKFFLFQVHMKKWRDRETRKTFCKLLKYNALAERLGLSTPCKTVRRRVKTPFFIVFSVIKSRSL